MTEAKFDMTQKLLTKLTKQLAIADPALGPEFLKEVMIYLCALCPYIFILIRHTKL